MERHEEILIGLLKSAMWGIPVSVPHDFKDWGLLFRLAKSQSVLALVADVILSDKETSSRISEKGQERLRSFMMANIMTAERLGTLISESVKLLRKAGIRPVLLKGQGLAAYYPDPRLRQCGDIDLYIGNDDYRKAYEIFKPLATKIDDIRKLDIGIHFDVNVGNLDIEVHRYTEVYKGRNLNRIYQNAAIHGTRENTVTMNFNGVEVETPSDVFNAFYIFGHMFRHFLYEGVGLRQLCDWMMFLHVRRDHIDTYELASLIDAMDMRKPWQAFGCVLVDVMGLPKEEFPLYDSRYSSLVDKIVRRVLYEGNFGMRRDLFQNKKHNYLIDKARSFFSHFVRLYELFSLFPKHALRQLGYTMSYAVEKVWVDIRLKLGKKADD